MIKFLDLQKINARFKDELKASFDAFLDSGRYVLGDNVTNFENEFAQYCGTAHCIGVSNGLDALKLIFEAYKALGILRDGDAVIVPANTYIATVLAVSDSGLTPVLVDANIATYNIDAEEVLKYITPKTKAVLGVHLYGQLYDVSNLEAIAKTYNLLLIEDAAQAHGATFTDGRKAGNVSDAGAFSFYPTKNLGAFGEAGAITTNNKALADVVFKLRNYGRDTAYKNDYKGYNCRLDELQAAFLRIKLKYLDKDNRKRQEIAKYYLEHIRSKHIKLPFCKDMNQHVFHQFVIRSKKRDALKRFLFDNGIETVVHYPIPIHKQKAYSEFSGLQFSRTEQIHDEVLSLPMSLLLEKIEIEKITNALSAFK